MSIPDFRSLGLTDPLLRAIEAVGYLAPTPIQAEVIPAVIAGVDVWASAPTGSGKTAAFVLPLLEMSSRPRERSRPCALVLVPTRELAAQIGDAARKFTRHVGTRFELRVVFGGVSINPQMMSLRGGADLIVATPGRLLDLVDKNAIDLSIITTVVLDEADRLLDRGFEIELARIFERLPEHRQTLLFSATFPPAVQALARSVLRDETRIDIAPDSPLEAPLIVERAIETDRARRTHLLRHLINETPSARILVFVATTYATEHVAEKLRALGAPAAALHGKLSQGGRTRALTDFRTKKLRVLVATDVAARGLDIMGLQVVVNYDLPRSPADYLHRVGRTGRAGERGTAISFVTPENDAHFRLIEKRQRRTIAREQVAGFEPDPDGATPPPTTGGIKGKRKSKKDKLREAAIRNRGQG